MTRGYRRTKFAFHRVNIIHCYQCWISKYIINNCQLIEAPSQSCPWGHHGNCTFDNNFVDTQYKKVSFPLHYYHTKTETFHQCAHCAVFRPMCRPKLLCLVGDWPNLAGPSDHGTLLLLIDLLAPELFVADKMWSWVCPSLSLSLSLWWQMRWNQGERCFVCPINWGIVNFREIQRRVLI